MAARLAVIIPTLDEAGRIRGALEALAPLRAQGHQVIVVDGGSADATRELAEPLCDRVVSSARGRALQMNCGARHASGDALVFLHVDTLLPPDGDLLIDKALENRWWGRFDVEIEGRPRLLKVVAWAMSLRSRLSGIATGDQAIFVRREAFPGFPEIALMEDVAFSATMKRASAPACLRARAQTSGRRWEGRGVLRTVWLMWRLRLAFALGADPARLAERYD